MLFLLLVCIQTVRQADNLRGSRCKREEGRGGRGMPCVYISTNVCLDGVELEPIFDEITKAVASIIGKPERYVMVILKGSLAMKFWGNKEAAAFGEVVSMGGINTQVKRKLISTLGTILQDKLSIPTTRFVLKVTDTTAGSKPVSKL